VAAREELAFFSPQPLHLNPQTMTATEQRISRLLARAIGFKLD
jgi:hypothetical protein